MELAAAPPTAEVLSDWWGDFTMELNKTKNVCVFGLGAMGFGIVGSAVDGLTASDRLQ